MARSMGPAPVVTLTAGLLATVQLGALSPLSDPIRADLGLSAGLLGVAISTVTLWAAVAATPVGAWSRRRRPTGLVAAGLLVMAGADIGIAAFAHSAAGLLGLRTLSGSGYLLVVVVGPRLLSEQIRSADRAMFFALWGACTPAGLAVGAGMGGLLGQLAGWRGWFLVLSAVTVLFALMTAAAHRSTPIPPLPPDLGRIRIGGRPLLVAVSFCLIALIGVAVAALLPSFLSGSQHQSTSTAGWLTSAVALSSVPGSVLGGVLLRRGVAEPRIGCAVLLCPVFALITFTLRLPLAERVVSAGLLCFAGGLGVAAAYGSLPRLVPAAELALANGMLVQLGSLGTLLAPPIFSAATDLRRWFLIAPMMTAPAVLGLVLLTLATRRSAASAALDPAAGAADRPPLRRSTTCN